MSIDKAPFFDSVNWHRLLHIFLEQKYQPKLKNDFDKIWSTMEAHFSMGPWSVHGPKHWRNVEQNGLQLARQNGADETVVRLFAAIHDVERENDGWDPDHGLRAAELAISLENELFYVEEKQLELLVEALRYHNSGSTSDQITIGTCWDADRMDLPRVGIIPEAKYMSTDLGKEFCES